MSKFEPRDVSFHLMIAFICLLGASVYALSLHPTPFICVFIGAAVGLNVGVVVESQRWKAAHPSPTEKAPPASGLNFKTPAAMTAKSVDKAIELTRELFVGPVPESVIWAVAVAFDNPVGENK